MHPIPGTRVPEKPEYAYAYMDIDMDTGKEFRSDPEPDCARYAYPGTG